VSAILFYLVTAKCVKMGKASPQPSAQESPHNKQEGDKRECLPTSDHSENNGVPQRFLRRDFVRARRRVLDRRARVSRERLRLQKKRYQLRRLRHEESQQESALVSALSESSFQANKDDKSSLSTLLKGVLETREKIKSQEDAYDEDEDAVAEQEWALETEEDRFHKTFEMNLIHDDDYASDNTSSSSVPAPAPTKDVLSSPRTANPLWDYQTKVGEAKILRERLDGLSMQQGEYLMEKQQLDSVGLQVDQSVIEFLDTYQGVREKYIMELAAAEEEIQSLHRTAVENGHLNPSPSYPDFGYYLPGPPPFEQPVTTLQDAISEPDFIPMAVQFEQTPNTGDDRVQAKDVIEPSAADSPRAKIYQWLKELPAFPVEKVSLKAKGIGAQGNSWMRSLQNFPNRILAYWKWDKSIAASDKDMKRPDLSCPEPLHKGYVNIEPLKSDPFAPSSPDLPVRSRTVQNSRPHSDGPDEETLYLPGPSPAPNASHNTPLLLYGLEPVVDDRESRSI
jgi:hypothetical protein